jgi:hypothetical protein
MLHQFDGLTDMIGDLSEVKFCARYKINRSTARGWKRRYLERKVTKDLLGAAFLETIRPPLTD